MNQTVDTEAFNRAREQVGPSFDEMSLREQIRVCAPDVPNDPASAWELPTGLHYGVSESVYHARKLGLVNKGALDRMHRTPAHYRAWVESSDEEASAALAFGKAFHCAVLEPDVFASTYVVQPHFGDLRTKDAKAARDTWMATNGSKIAITEDDAARIEGMCASIDAHPKSWLLQGGHAEVTLRWDDEDTGLACKARVDYYRADFDTALDLKSTLDAGAEAFAKSCATYRYHVQQSHYSKGFAAIGRPLQNFVFVAVEKEPPYACAFYVLDAEAQEMGAVAWRDDMSKFAECMGSGDFPAYDTGIQQLTLPRWTK